MSNFDLEALGNRIKELREQYGWTQEDLLGKLQDYMHIEHSTLKKFETGRQDFKTKHIIALAEIFGVTSDYILGLSGTPSTNPDIQAISKYTGLDEQAVEFLHLENEPARNSTEIINAFFKSYEFWSIIDELQSIENHSNFIFNDCEEKLGEQADTIKECVQLLDSYYSKNPKSKNDLKHYMEQKQNLKLAQFGCDDSFKDIVKAFVDGRELTPYYPDEDEE